MRLLVSVRNGVEAVRIVEGGADIVDAKEPARGPLGAVDAEVLSEIVGAVPTGVPLSVALGDLGAPDVVAGVLAAIGERGGRADYLKVGFAGVTDEALVRRIIERVVAAASALPGCPRVVAAAYADHGEARSVHRHALAKLAADGGAHGVLLDTWTKDGRDVFAWISSSTLKEWVRGARSLRLTVAVAGSIGPDSMPTVLGVEPDIVGVRGAACEGGRTGTVSVARVRGLKSLLDTNATPYQSVT